MKILALPAASLLPLSATPENPLIPDSWFQDLTATDGSTQQCIIFNTIAGVEYTFYHSYELEEWTEVGKTYCLGHQFSATMRETAPAPPPPDPENPPPPGPVFLPASITIKPSSGTAGGTVVSWPSLDHGNAMQYLITGNMVSAWSSVPLFAENHGTHHFFISHTPGDAVPPEENPILETEDAAMIADLEAAWSTFNTSVTTTLQTAINTPPPPPPAIDAKGFWRIKADWSLDSDGDGSPDHLEFANTVAGPNGLAGNAFNADMDGNGIPDGKQLDKDDDGIPDADDAFNDNPDIAFKIISLPRYAMFEIPGSALQINDQGTVLFPWRVWKNGSITGMPNGHTARGINDEDLIIGTADRISGEIEDRGELDGEVFVMSAPNGPPEYPSFLAPKKDASGNPLPGGATVLARDHHDSVTTYGPSPIISGDGDFVAHGSVADGALGGGEVLADDTDTALAHWRRGANPERIGIDYITRHFFTGLGINHPLPAPNQQPVPISYSWGWDFEKPEGEMAFVNSDTGALSGLPAVPLNIIKQNVNRTSGAVASYIATFPEDGNGIYTTAKIHIDGSWKDLGELGNAVDFSIDGSAVGRPFPGVPAPILLNGEWTGMERYAPGAPIPWLSGDSARLTDTTPGGWVLAVDQTQAKSAALLPIRLKGHFFDSANNLLETNVGVDDFSITSSDPDKRANPNDLTTPIQNRIWIMAPIGSVKNIVLEAPLHSTAPLKMTAGGISFDSAAELVANSPETLFAINATTAPDGVPVYPELKIGNTVSSSSPIAFLPMKGRIVRVGMHIVSSAAPGRADIAPRLLPADAQQAAQEVQDYLNDIYSPQTNVRFEVVPIEESVAFDTADAAQLPGPTPPVPGDNELQFSLLGKNETAPILANRKGLEIYDLEVFVVGGIARMKQYISYTPFPNQLWITDSLPLGQAEISGENYCFVDGHRSGSGISANTTEHVYHTISHEIGHLIFGGGHPDEEIHAGRGPAPLPDSDFVRRLMCSGPRNNLGSKLIVKSEWDAGLVWLRARPKGDV